MTITTEKCKIKLAHTARENFTYIYYETIILDDYCAVTVCELGLFPSMASFFFRQFVQRNGPSHGLDAGEKKGPEFTDRPFPGG